MEDEIISMNEIYIQDLIFDAVNFLSPDAEDIVVYNSICEEVDCRTLEQLDRVMDLIHLNQRLLKEVECYD